MSREFFYLYENTALKQCNVVGLIDNTPFKQTSLTFKGMNITDERVLTNAPKDSVVFITAFAHQHPIMKRIQETNFKGKTLWP